MTDGGDSDRGSASDGDTGGDGGGDRSSDGGSDGSSGGGGDSGSGCGPAATGAGEVRVWLVERSYDSRNLITLVYATPDGERALTQERSSSIVMQGEEMTAGMDVESDRLEPVDDGERRERYAQEAARMSDRHDPDDAV